MQTTSAPPRRPSLQRQHRLSGLAAGTAAVMAVLYGLIFAGVLTVVTTDDGRPGILGVAGLVFAAIAVLLWRTRSRSVWVAVAALQVLMGAMYVAVAPEREPSFEVWGVTLRALSVVLVVALVALVLDTIRQPDR